MAPNVSVITIRWLLTVETEIAFFLFHSLAEGVPFFLLKLMRFKKNSFSKVNFTRKTDIVLIAHAISDFSLKCNVECTS